MKGLLNIFRTLRTRTTWSLDGQKCVETLDRKGRLHSFGDQPSQVWFRDGEPSQEYWHRHGTLHRDDGPAHIDHGSQATVRTWYRDGKYHRDAGPAQIVTGTIESLPYCYRYFTDGEPTKAMSFNEIIFHSNGLPKQVGHLNDVAEYQSVDGLPSLIEFNRDGGRIFESWHEEGQLHRLDEPAKIEYFPSRLTDDPEDNVRVKFWFIEGEEWRADGEPVCEVFNEKGDLLSARWDGADVSEDQPTVETYFSNGDIWRLEWRDTKSPDHPLHRVSDGGPAFVEYDRDGNIIEMAWYRAGKLHGQNGMPARYTSSPITGEIVCEEWFRDGKRDRDDGPAIIEYWLDGTVRREEWRKADHFPILDQDEPQIIDYNEQGRPVTFTFMHPDGRKREHTWPDPRNPFGGEPLARFRDDDLPDSGDFKPFCDRG